MYLFQYVLFFAFFKFDSRLFTATESNTFEDLNIRGNLSDPRYNFTHFPSSRC